MHQISNSMRTAFTVTIDLLSADNERVVLRPHNASMSQAIGELIGKAIEAAPGEMDEAVFEEHHVLINLKDEPMRVENWRDGQLRDFVFRKFEVVVTPAGVESGWL